MGWLVDVCVGCVCMFEWIDGGKEWNSSFSHKILLIHCRRCCRHLDVHSNEKLRILPLSTKTPHPLHILLPSSLLTPSSVFVSLRWWFFQVLVDGIECANSKNLPQTFPFETAPIFNNSYPHSLRPLSDRPLMHLFFSR